ncbi:MAG: protein kinase domain-containing protein [Isosphaeraceae bacterium]
MTQHETCPNCGGEMPPNAPQGLCPACLLQQGLESQGGDRPRSTPPSPSDPDATNTFQPGVEPEIGEVAVELGTNLHYFGDYELIRELGRGGMGVVYKARQLSLNRPVALKLLKSDILASDDERRRFQNEAEAVALLDHPHIVPIFEVGEHDRRQYFSMKLVGGPSLEKKLAAYAGDPKAIARLVKTAAEAVHHAHQCGILHRDLKPSNILLDERGEPYVTDFGLAKRIEGDSEMTVSGAILGTPSYMAPEQASGRRGAVTTATDVHGLGAILYSLLTGRAPFQGKSVAEVLEAVRELAPNAPSKFSASIPRDLEIICLKCLEKDPPRRYASAQAVADDLHRYVAGEPITARPASSFERLWLWCKRNPKLAAAVGSTAAALVLVAVFALLFADRRLKLAAAAAKARSLAIEKEAEAEKARALAREKELARQFIYDDRMLQVKRAWEGNNWESNDRKLFLMLLERARPDANDPTDRRRFEWYYWRRKIGSGRHHAWKPREMSTETGLNREAYVRLLAFSPDGTRLASLGPGPDGEVGRRPLEEVILWDVATRKKVATRQISLLTKTAFERDDVRFDDPTARHVDWHEGRLDRIYEGSVRSLYVDPIRLMFSPDGRNLAAVCDDGTTRLWDTQSLREVWKIESHCGAVSAIFSPDGRIVATGGADGTVRLWDAGSGVARGALPGHKDVVVHVAFSPDGKHIASVGADRTLKIREMASGRESLSVSIQYLDLSALAFTSDGRNLIASLRDSPQRSLEPQYYYVGGELLNAVDREATLHLRMRDPYERVRFLDAGTGREHTGFGTQGGAVAVAAFSRDAKRFAGYCLDGTIRIWDTTTRLILATLRPGADFHDSNIVGLALSADGRQLATAGWAGIEVWDAVTGQDAVTLQGHCGPTTSVSFSRDGRSLTTSGRDESVRVWNTHTWEEIPAPAARETHVPHGGESSASSPDGGRIVSANREDGVIRVSDAKTGRDLLRIPLEIRSQPTYAWFNGDGTRIISAGGFEFGGVSVFDSTTGQRLLSFGHVLAVDETWALSSDNRFLAALDPDRVGPRSRKLAIWSISTGQKLFECDCTRTLSGHCSFIRFSADDRRLVAGTRNGDVVSWADTAGPAAGHLPGHTGNTSFCKLALDRADGILEVTRKGGKASDLDIDHDCRMLAVCFDGVVTLWDLAIGRKKFALNSPADPVENLAFSPDGARLLTKKGEVAKIWRVDTGRTLCSLAGRLGENSWEFSPDSRQIASAGPAGTTVYDVTTGRPLLSLAGHAGGWVNDAVFSPDGRKIASAGEDRTVRVWDADTKEEILRINCDSVSARRGTSAPAAPQKFAQRLADDNSIRRAESRSKTRPGSTHGEHNSSIRRLAFSPDGKRLAWSGSDFTRVWDLEHDREVLTIEGHPGWFTGLAFSPDGAQIATASPDALLRMWDARTGKETIWFEGQTRVVEREMEYAPSPFDRVRSNVARFDNRMQALAYSPDGRLIAAFYRDPRFHRPGIAIWSARSGRKALDLKYEYESYLLQIAAGERSGALTFSPDSRRLAGAVVRGRLVDRTHDVCIWDAETGEVLSLLRGHAGEITDLAITPDGNRLASASLDGTVRIWDLKTGLEVLTLDEHAGGVEGLAFSPDGRRLASANHDGTIRIWDARPVAGEQ